MIQPTMYGQYILTGQTRIDVMSRLGRAMADPTRARILLSLLERAGQPVTVARDLELTRTKVSDHLACLCVILTASVGSTLTV